MQEMHLVDLNILRKDYLPSTFSIKGNDIFVIHMTVVCMFY